MKIFELLGRKTWLSKKSDEVRILLATNDDAMNESAFQKLCQQIVAELKEKYDADNENLPSASKKRCDEIMTEIAQLLCGRSHFSIISFDGRFQLQGFFS